LKESAQRSKSCNKIIKNKKMEKIKNKKLRKRESGFTLIEILVVIGLIALLAAVVIIAINPARQFAQGRNAQRVSNVNAILNAIGQNIADNKGVFTCGVSFSADKKFIKSGADEYDIRSCIVPTYISELPVDPTDGIACADSACGDGYDTKYTVVQDANGRVTVCAPNSLGENALGDDLDEICVTR